MKKILICISGIALAFPAMAQVKKATAVKKPAAATVPKNILKNEEDTISYAVGVSVGNMMSQSDVTEINGKLLQKGVEDALNNIKPVLPTEQVNLVLQKHLEICRKEKEPGVPKVIKPVSKSPLVKSGDPKQMRNLLDSFSYAAGLNIGGNMKSQGFTVVKGDLLQKAASAVLQKKPTLITNEMANMKLQERMKVFMQKKLSEEKAKGAAFLAANKERSGVVTLPNGLQYEIIKSGTDSIKPSSQDQVTVHYVGTFIDGVEFDGSRKRNQPATFSVGGVIKGWTQILQLMTKGDNWKVYIPGDLAYGDGGNNGIPPGATLIFEIELLDIVPAK